MKHVKLFESYNKELFKQIREIPLSETNEMLVHNNEQYSLLNVLVKMGHIFGIEPIRGVDTAVIRWKNLMSYPIYVSWDALPKDNNIGSLYTGNRKRYQSQLEFFDYFEYADIKDRGKNLKHKFGL